MLEGEPNIGDQRPAHKPINKLMVTKFDDNWIDEQAIDCRKDSRRSVHRKPTRRNKENAARGIEEFHWKEIQVSE